MIRFGLLLASILGLAACSEPADTIVDKPTAELDRPNVLFILVDDMGFGDVGYNGSEIATPNLDQLASVGVRLDRNYVYPICSPTRTALLTGHSPFEFGVVGPMGDHTGLPLDVKLMPEYFKDLGYQTAMIGKWHLGVGNTDYWPLSRGFDYFYGFLGGWVDFYTHVYNGGLDWQRDGKSVREEGYATDLFTTDAIRVIKSRDPDRPLFMYLAYNAPHSPLQFTPASSGFNSEIVPTDRSVYTDMVKQADNAIGQVIGTLKEQGILDKTIVVFSSDNGGALNLGASNGELRLGKGSAYEGGMRVPGAIWWPGHVEGGVVMEQPIAVHDWLPTLLEAVGGDPSVVTNAYGQSMWAAIARGEQIDRAVTTIGVANSRAAFDWPWKVVRTLGRGANAAAQLSLHNVLTDPDETTDLSAQYPEIFAELVAVLDAIPSVESRAESDDSPRPEQFFRGEDGAWDYQVRVPETLPPWAETAVRGTRGNIQ